MLWHAPRPDGENMNVDRPGSIFIATAWLALAVASAGAARPTLQRLPDAVTAPLSVDSDDDAILQLANKKTSLAALREALMAAIERSPVLLERVATADEALAAKHEVFASALPNLDLSMNGNRVLARNYTNIPDTVVERARGNGRVDSAATLQQLIFDFGATSRRFKAASAREVAARADAEGAIETVILRGLGAWYDVVSYGQLAAIGESLARDQARLKSSIDSRIAEGLSAPVDRARIDSALAFSAVRLASIQRELGNAAARYQDAFGAMPDGPLLPPEVPTVEVQTLDLVALKAAKTAPVRAAEASARAAHEEVRAALADKMFSVVGTVEAGRFGTFDTSRNDYDVRARVTLRQRFNGQMFARVDQVKARARGADARADATRDDAVQQARIAWTDVEALRTSLGAARENYIASRITRDATFERFRYSRGTLFDVLEAQDSYFQAAANYIRSLSEYDAARYVLLSRSGQLLPALEISPNTERSK